MAFVKAVKSEAKLRLAIAGPSGSGKTYTSLAVATALGGPIAYVDTEHGSASKYADVFAFDVLEMEPPFHPRRFAEAIKEAANAGYKVIILDSMTHAWNGTGGMLDIVEEIAKRSKNPNSFAAWKEATPIQNALIDAIVSAPIHVVATMRSKQEYVQDRDERTGKTSIRKVGMAPQQRDGFEYEFDVFLDMDIDNNAIVSKTRCPALTGRVFNKPGADIAKILTDWLHGAPAQERKPAPAPKAEEKKSNGVTGTHPGTASTQKDTESKPIPDDAPQVVKDWIAAGKPDNAFAWAVTQGAAPEGAGSAKELMREITRTEFGGQFTENAVGVYTAFYHKCLAIVAETEAAELEAKDGDNPFESVPTMAEVEEVAA